MSGTVAGAGRPASWACALIAATLIAATLLAPLGAPLVKPAWADGAPAAGTRALRVNDYLAAGYRSEAVTMLPGVFTGCTKDKSYIFADSSTFQCKGTQPGLAVRPRVWLLVGPDGRTRALLIGGHAFAGGVRLVRDGRPGAIVSAVADAPATAGPARPGLAVPAIHPIEVIQTIEPLHDNRQNRADEIQTYVMRHRVP